MSIHAEALRLAELGYFVFPLAAGCKVPLKDSAGCKDATTDAVKVAFWFADETKNIGLSTNGLIVVDIDDLQWIPQNPDRALDLARAPYQQTPRGGRHYVFRQNGVPVRNSASKVAPHIDIRGDGGYIVVSPSQVNGKKYEWITALDCRPEDLPTPPLWLMDLIEKAAKKTKPLATVPDASKVRTGERNDWLFRRGCKYWNQNPDIKDVQIRLTNDNRERCEPPVSDDEVAKIAESCSRYDSVQIADVIANHRWVETEDKKKHDLEAVHISTIRTTLEVATDGWPRRVDNLLFADEAGKIVFLERTDEIYSWMHAKAALKWKPGADKFGRSLVTKNEFAAHLRQEAKNYAAVEELPHFPSIANVYYSWTPPQDYAPEGHALMQLLGFFNNCETVEDTILLYAMFLTPAWGGRPGARPAFVIMSTDRGFGKTEMADAVANLYGGAIDIGNTENAEEKLLTRLLSPDALTRRILRFDNVKYNAESATLENLITSKTISGHRMYSGEANRPNYITTIITGNSLRLSRDLAERAFIIKLKRPEYVCDWAARLNAHIDAHRNEILADICECLAGPATQPTTPNRHAEWCAEVLGRVTDRPDDVIRATVARRAACDEELEEAATLMGALDVEASKQGGEGSVFLSSTMVAQIVRVATGEAITTKRLRGVMEDHINAGRLPRVQYMKTRAGRGYLIKPVRDERTE